MNQIQIYSDRGAKYTVRLLAEWAAANGVRLSAGRMGSCHDNARPEASSSARRGLLQPGEAPFDNRLPDACGQDGSVLLADRTEARGNAARRVILLARVSEILKQIICCDASFFEETACVQIARLNHCFSQEHRLLLCAKPLLP